MRKAKISQGDLVRVDYPGTSIHNITALVAGLGFTDEYCHDSDRQIEILICDTAKPIMIRRKWIKIISKIKEKSP